MRPDHRTPWLGLLLPLLVLLALAAGCAIAPPDVRLGHAVPAGHGAVACVDRYAAQVGAQVLAEGGNAVDAAVASAFALAVTWPPAGNLGGGGVAIVAMADGRRVALDFRETAPAALHVDHFLDADGHYDPAKAADPWWCTGVPGTVAGLAQAHARFGRLSWSRLLEPAIELAEQGFVVDSTLSRFLADAEPGLAAVPASRAIFLDPFGGHVPRPGAVLVQTDLAGSLRTLARQGGRAFYDGPLAQALADDVRGHGGLLSAHDLLRYQALEREPLAVEWHGHELLAMPPPSAGGVVLAQILGLLDRTDALALEPDGPAAVHLFAEASRRAFAERARWLGDPDFTAVPVDTLLSATHLDVLAASIDPAAASSSTALGPPLTWTEPDETTQLSVLDAAGNAVALTYTLEANCGGKAVAGGTGILLNNELGDFNRVPGRTDARGFIGTPPNLPSPGKRPLTSMCPVVVLRDGAPVLVTGSPGGRTILDTVALVVLRVIGRGQPLRTALDAPRAYHGWWPDQIVLEADADPGLVAALGALGHTVRVRAADPPLFGTQGAAHTIGVDATTGTLQAVADRRRDGWVAAPADAP